MTTTAPTKTAPTTTAMLSTRRAFLHDGSLLLFAAGATVSTVSAGQSAELERKVRIGLLTDLHYADKPAAGTRFYRDTLTKLAETAQQFRLDQPDFVVELGDLIDAAGDIATEKQYLARINQEFTALPGEKHYVLGNHCVHTLTKSEFLDGIARSKSHYSFDSGGFHFVILDACFRSDGVPYGRDNFQWNDANIPFDQLEWLKGDLQATANRTIVLAHQRLDVQTDVGVKNAAQVRSILEQSGKVLAVFQGHSHHNALRDIAGIHYCTLEAMVEGSGVKHNGYAMMDLYANGDIRITGYRSQSGYDWRQPVSANSAPVSQP